MLKRIFLVFLLSTIMSLTFFETGIASPIETEEMHQVDETAFMCSTRQQLRHPQRCASVGPASQLAEYARKGWSPSQTLPADSLDPSLSYVPFSYLKVSPVGVHVFPTLGNALRGTEPSRVLGKGFVYVSYTDRYEQDGKVVYQIGPGEYIRGDHVSRISTPTFSGLLFRETPKNTFGWVMTTVTASAAPGYDQPMTNQTYYRYQIVQVYEIKKVGDFEWYMVAPGQWIEQRRVALVQPDTTRPEGIPENRWVSVNLYEQTIAIYEDSELIFASLVSSGLRGWWTRPGVFQVYKEYVNDGMQGAFEADRSDFYYLEDVPWVMYYDDDRALHGAYWHNNFGYQQSHGCVNLAPADAQWIFEWVEEGTWVYVWDPSGETPTDDESYING
jgi:lipoprotein-anchoring transpeptidase ErfK/SrfK